MKSPNHGHRKGQPIDMVVLHYTAMRDPNAAMRHLCDPRSGVSCHWIVARNGETRQIVSEDRRAWHAGAGRWGQVNDVNSRSIGIELDNTGFEPFADVQILALIRLMHGIMLRHPAIRPERVVGHSCIAPWRKNDPGPFFPWDRLAVEGLVIGLGDVTPAPLANLPVDLSTIGFPAGPTPFAMRLRALRLRHRPETAGQVREGGLHAAPPDAVDAGIARAVAAAWPVAGGPDLTVIDALDRAAIGA